MVVAEATTVESRLCVSPLLYGPGQVPQMVVHLEHELRDAAGETLAEMHLHRLVDPLGAEALSATIGFSGETYLVTALPAAGTRWMDVEDFAQLQVDASHEVASRPR